MPVYMQYPDIKGDSSEPDHYEWIVLSSVSFAPDRVRPKDLTVTKAQNNLSADLRREMLEGRARDVTIALTKQEDRGEQDYLRVNLKGAIISSISVFGDSESLTFNFHEIEHDYVKAYGFGDTDY